MAGHALRIAVVSPGANVWSETFIAAHIERLNTVDLLLTGGEPPRKASRGLLASKTRAGMFFDRVQARLYGGFPSLLRQRLHRLLLQERPQVLLAEYGTAAASVLEPCERAGIPMVVHFHGFDAHDEVFIAEHDGYKEVFRYARALVVVSRIMEQQLLQLGAPLEKVIYNCYGIDVERFMPGDPARNAPHFLAVGRFTEKKAPLRTLQAFQRVLKERPEARLTMVGQGKLWETCKAFTTSNNMDRAVDLCGIRTPLEIASLLRESRAFVQHSVVGPTGDQEGTPLAVLEAMACGLPVVATRHAGIMDVVKEAEHGLLCDEHDVESMARNMIRLVDQPELARSMGRAGRSYVEIHHRVEVQVHNLQRILQHAAQP